MRLIALGAANAVATVLAFGVEAADFSAVGPPQYGVTPPPAVAPPQVLVVPGAPVAVPRYNGTPMRPPVVGYPPYAEAPPVTSPGVAPGTSLPPRAACDPVWRCGNSGCGWSPGCAPHPEPYAPHPEPYSGPYGSPAPQVYAEAPRPPEPYPGYYWSPGPRVYSGREAPPPPDPSSGPYAPQVSGPYAPQVSGPYAPQVYSGQTGRMRWMIGPQPYGM
jgi:hypothetical protein